MNAKLKLLLGIIYGLSLAALFSLLFTHFDIKDLTNYSFIKENSKSLINYKNENIILFTITFFAFSAAWVFLLGFGSPIAIISGFIFGKWIGTLISVLAFTLGSSFLYLMAGLYFNKFTIKNFSHRIEKYKNLFNKNELLYFMIFRFTGGAGIPFAIQNVLPVIFDMKLKNYIFSTLIGLIPTIFIINSLGSGIKNLININASLSYQSVILDPEIYIPLLFFLLILIVSFIIKKKFFK